MYGNTKFKLFEAVPLILRRKSEIKSRVIQLTDGDSQLNIPEYERWLDCSPAVGGFRDLKRGQI